jgi:hypothetical protein
MDDNDYAKIPAVLELLYKLDLVILSTVARMHVLSPNLKPTAVRQAAIRLAGRRLDAGTLELSGGAHY